MKGSWKHSLTTFCGVLFAGWVQPHLPTVGSLDISLLAAGATGFLSHFLHMWICATACGDHGDGKVD